MSTSAPTSRFVSSISDFAMARSVAFQSVKQKSSYDLPVSLSREIGRIVTRWAYYEHYIQRMIWAIVLDGYENGAALGRVALRETKPDEQLGLLEWVAEIREVTLNSSLIASMRPKAKNLNAKRNLVAHGLWTDVGGEWNVQETRGAWDEFKDGPRGSRKIQPQSIPMTATDLRQIWSDLELLIADAKKLKGTIGET